MATTVALTAATATFTLTKNLTSDDTILIGARTLKIEETPGAAYDVQLGADQTATIANIVAAVNGSGTAGTHYYTGTLSPAEITAAATSTTLITFTAMLKGAVGNSFRCTEGVDGGTAFTCLAFSGGSGDISGTSGYIQSMISNSQINADCLTDLKRLTYATD